MSDTSQVTELLSRAQAEGVELLFSDGQLMAKGAPDVLATWAPTLRAHKPALLSLLTGQEPEPKPDWRVLDRAYQAHHFNCPHCIAAGKGYGKRCAVGLTLWASCQEASHDE